MTKIEWTDATWNPIVGCTAVSPGCAHCYAAGVARREMQPAHKGLTNGRGHWTGEVRLLHERLAEPLHWRKPRRVFVCSMSDLFHEDVPDEFIDRVFAVMALAPQHTFQVLTKRPKRMQAYIEAVVSDRVRYSAWAAHGCPIARVVNRAGEAPALWPLPNVWLGVSCEDQQRADERIPLLLQTPAAVRFVSAEPLLGPVDLTLVRRGDGWEIDALGGVYSRDVPEGIDHPAAREVAISHHRIDWVIVGGESGPGARPCDVAWIRAIVGQCRAASVPCFVKQLGARPFESPAPLVVEQSAESIMRYGEYDPEPWPAFKPKDRKGGDPAEWPADLRVREWPR